MELGDFKWNRVMQHLNQKGIPWVSVQNNPDTSSDSCLLNKNLHQEDCHKSLPRSAKPFCLHVPECVREAAKNINSAVRLPLIKKWQWLFVSCDVENSDSIYQCSSMCPSLQKNIFWNLFSQTRAFQISKIIWRIVNLFLSLLWNLVLLWSR